MRDDLYLNFGSPRFKLCLILGSFLSLFPFYLRLIFKSLQYLSLICFLRSANLKTRFFKNPNLFFDFGKSSSSSNSENHHHQVARALPQANLKTRFFKFGKSSSSGSTRLAAGRGAV
jgi:hypothetical protein